MLAASLTYRGCHVEVVRSYAEAFALACARDFEALLTSPFLRDSSALVLPAALGIRRPPVAVLTCRLTERLDGAIVRRVGFDAQLVKAVDAAVVVRLIAQARRADAALIETFGPKSENGRR